MSHTAKNDARPFGKCSECPEHVRLTANGKVGRHKRLPGAREFGTDKVWCEGSGVAPARVIPPTVTDEVTS